MSKEFKEPQTIEELTAMARSVVRDWDEELGIVSPAEELEATLELTIREVHSYEINRYLNELRDAGIGFTVSVNQSVIGQYGLFRKKKMVRMNIVIGNKNQDLLKEEMKSFHTQITKSYPDLGSSF